MKLRTVLLSLVIAITLSNTLLAADEKPVPADHPERAKKGLALFKSNVRAILTKNCLDCHGGKSTKGDFDLSTREALMKSGYVEKTAASSQLMRVVRHEEEPFMPLKAEKLDDKSIKLLADWIDLGAPYDTPLVEGAKTGPKEMKITDDDRKFWSFRPLSNPPVPAVKATAWPKTDIDRFVLAKQEQAGLRPNNAANKRVLIRRAYFDLLGLPPKPEEVDQFVNDTDPQAWPKLIDRLLESPHYGERWARHWMDIARFAESHGYEQDYDRPHAYHYRDFLIKALNQDMPYQQFLQWQLAGDEFAPNDPLALAATGFLGAASFPTQLTEVEFEPARYDELDDMVTTTGVSFLGLSVGCARCHDHKFDPIPSVDYYRMASSFTTAIRSEIDVDLEPEANKQRKATFDAKSQELAEALKQYEQTQLAGRFKEFLAKEAAAPSGPWENLSVVSVTSSAQTKFNALGDSSYLATGKVPAKDVITVVADTRKTDIRAIRVEALKDDSLPAKGPGRAGNGNFVLTDFQVAIQPLGKGDAKPESVKFASARATHQQNTGDLSVAGSIDDQPTTGWAVDVGGIGKDQAAIFDTAAAVGGEGGSRLTITLSYNHPNPNHSLGRFRLSVSSLSQPKPESGNAGPDGKVLEALTALKQNADEKSDHWKTAIAWFAPQDPAWQKLKASVDEHQKKGPGLALTKMMVTSEGFPKMPHHGDGRGFTHFYPKTFVLRRGDVHQKVEEASLNFLQVLMPDGTSSAKWQVPAPEGWTRTSFRRASLANWMTDTHTGAGALAARVIVNRLWDHHFGRGIVGTPNDFGLQGDRPTHPELLDWLANDLVANGWKLKRLHKLMMTSAVFMQSGEFDEARAKLDRDNFLLWRRAPLRLEAEAIRDSLLAVSGTLDERMYGPGTLDQNMRRRSVYFFIKRSGLIPMMMLFDWPEHLVSIGARSRTTIAPQALMFMNSPQGRQYAAALAARLEAAPADQRVTNAYRIAFGRVPSQKEAALANQFVTAQSAAYQTAGKPNAAHLALTDFCQTLFSMNEFVYSE